MLLVVTVLSLTTTFELAVHFVVYQLQFILLFISLQL